MSRWKAVIFIGLLGFAVTSTVLWAVASVMAAWHG